MLSKRRRDGGSKSHVEHRMPGVSYATAFRILGPTPRTPRKPDPKPGGKIVFPDSLVLRVRQLAEVEGLTPSQIKRALASEADVSVTWITSVRDYIIRPNVKENS